MASIKKNYLLNLTNTISTLLFPLVTFPYASRVMLADGIGQVNFFTSIVSYISLFTCLGIPMYAIRETARVRDNREALSQTTMEILLLHTCLTILGYVTVIVICMTVPKVTVDIPLFLLLSTSIFFTAIGCEWFYQAIEDFKYITIRAIFIKSVCVLLLFLLVHTKEDLMYYAAYTVLGSVGNNVFNFFRLRKFIHLRDICLHDLKPFRHLKPALHIFVLNLVISIYVHIDTVMLGFMKEPAAVGYYAGATRLTKLMLAIVSSLGTVMLPRLSNLIRIGKKEEFDRLSQKAIGFVIALSLPLFIGLFISAPMLIRLFCGPSYEPAILTLQIVSPILLFIALSNVLGIQILYPQGRENTVIFCTLIGALLNFSLNLVLIPYCSQNGAAIATCIAEFGVTFMMLIVGKKYIPVSYSFKKYHNYVVGSIFMCVVCYGVMQIGMNDVLKLLFVVLVGMIVYGSYLYYQKDALMIDIIRLLRKVAI